MSNNTALEWIDNNQSIIRDAARSIWEFAEISLEERQSADLLLGILRNAGFRITEGIGGIPTAFMAEWGEGKPRLGFLAEYDALPHLSQQAVPEQKPITPDGPGHGCQHNLLGAGCLGAVLGVLEELKNTGGEGTVVFYGCPAEETLVGKVYMARDGVFDSLDAAIAWHPSPMNGVISTSMLAMNSMKFTFHGRTAHAAADPQNGRSALDAVELMNVAANYLREHVETDVRLHYAITNGGGEPNVVPAKAQVWYYVRAPRRDGVEAVSGRLKRIAEGAALMTETTFDVEFLSGAYDAVPNEVLGHAMAEALVEVGAPEWDAEDQTFAAKIAESFPPGAREGIVRMFGMPPEMAKMTLHSSTLPDLITMSRPLPGSSDVGDVSHIVPTVMGGAATSVFGSPAHSWQNVATAGTEIGFKGTVVAAKTMALTALKLLRDPELLVKAKEEFNNKTGGVPYVSPLPEGQQPPFSQFS